MRDVKSLEKPILEVSHTLTDMDQTIFETLQMMSNSFTHLQQYDGNEEQLNSLLELLGKYCDAQDQSYEKIGLALQHMLDHITASRMSLKKISTKASINLPPEVQVDKLRDESKFKKNSMRLRLVE